jgi:hypothetical protein
MAGPDQTTKTWQKTPRAGRPNAPKTPPNVMQKAAKNGRFAHQLNRNFCTNARRDYSY